MKKLVNVTLKSLSSVSTIDDLVSCWKYIDSTGVVVSNEVGCCSWPFYRQFLFFNFDLSKSGGATAVPTPMVVTPLHEYEYQINNVTMQCIG